MNVDKAVVKMELSQHWARRFESLETAVRNDVHRLEGGKTALVQAANALDGHRSYYQDACDKGELGGTETKLCMDVITRCVGGLQNLVDRTEVHIRIKQGELQGLKRAIDELEKDFKAEKGKVEAVAKILESGGEYDGRPQLDAAADIRARKERAAAEKEAANVVPIKRKRKKAAKKTTRKKAD